MEIDEFINKICEKCSVKYRCSVLAYKDEPYHYGRLVDECPAVQQFIKLLIKIKGD